MQQRKSMQANLHDQLALSAFTSTRPTKHKHNVWQITHRSSDFHSENENKNTAIIHDTYRYIVTISISNLLHDAHWPFVSSRHYLTANKVSKSEGTRKVEYAHHF